jgi:hypothetical protein
VRSTCGAWIDKQVDSQSLQVYAGSMFYCPKHACFLLCFMPVPDEVLMRKPKHVARCRQWRIFFEDIVVINGPSVHLFLLIKFVINATNNSSITNVYKFSLYHTSLT